MDMNKTYLIDSENVGDCWIQLLGTVAPEDDILVFYTQKSPHMSYKNVILLKESAREPSFIECCEGNNALDFQLCTELGFRICEDAARDYIIVSNDNGFEAMVKYWRQRKVSVRRIQGKACAFETEPIRTESESASEEPQPPVASPEPAEPAMNAPEAAKPLTPVIPDLAKEILYIVGKSSLQDLHEALQQLYETKEAQSIYNAFKSDASYNSFLARHEKMSLTEKQQAYCAIVFSVSAPDEPVPEDFPEFITAAWKKKKNLNSFRSLLQQKYGKEKSDRYYSLFKGHIKIIDKLK